MISNESSHSNENDIVKKSLREHGMQIAFAVFSVLWLTLIAATWTMS